MKFIVSCDHVAPEYRLCGVVFSEGSSELYSFIKIEDRFSASAPRFGCGKDHASPELAIRGLLASNGCTKILITCREEDPALTSNGTPQDDAEALRALVTLRRVQSEGPRLLAALKDLLLHAGGHIEGRSDEQDAVLDRARAVIAACGG